MPPAPGASPVQLPVALTIAGSDSGGGAGIQADLKTFEARDVFGTSAITAITAQNTTGVDASQPIDPDVVRQQIWSVVDDFPVGAVKTGMLATPDITETVASTLSEIRNRPTGGEGSGEGLSLVVDPVMVAEAGDPLLADDAINVLEEGLVPQATFVTPNADEAELLTGRTVETAADVEHAARELVNMGANAALVTGGHLDGDPIDILVTRDSDPDQGLDPKADGETVTRFEHDRLETAATHGSGCTISATITAELAKGAQLHDAAEAGVEFVTETIRFGYNLGAGAGPVHHLAPMRTRADVGDQCRTVSRAVAELASPEFAPLVPEVGMNVAAAPRYATSPDDVVAIDGRLHRTTTGVRATGGAVPGASSHVARFLLGIRETDPTVAAACNVRHSREIGAVLRDEDAWDVEVIDRTNEPDDAAGTMDWAAREAMRDREQAPDAVLDDGAVGKEAMVRVVAESVPALVEKLRDLIASLELDADVVEPLVVDGEVDEQRRE